MGQAFQEKYEWGSFEAQSDLIPKIAKIGDLSKT
jgi:hypothetical protein